MSKSKNFTYRLRKNYEEKVQLKLYFQKFASNMENLYSGYFPF